MKIEQLIEILTKKIKESKDRDAGWRGAFRNIHFSELQIDIGEDLLSRLQKAQNADVVGTALHLAVQQLQTLYIDTHVLKYNNLADDSRRILFPYVDDDAEHDAVEAREKLDKGEGTKFYSAVFALLDSVIKEGVTFPEKGHGMITVGIDAKLLPHMSLNYIIKMLQIQVKYHLGYVGRHVTCDLIKTLENCSQHQLITAVEIAQERLQQYLLESHYTNYEFISTRGWSDWCSNLRNLAFKMRNEGVFPPADANRILKCDLDGKNLFDISRTHYSLISMIRLFEKLINSQLYIPMEEDPYARRHIILPGEDVAMQRLIKKLDEHRNADNAEFALQEIKLALKLAKMELDLSLTANANNPFYFIFYDKPSRNGLAQEPAAQSVVNYYVTYFMNHMESIDTKTPRMRFSQLIATIKEKISESQSSNQGIQGFFRNRELSNKQIAIGSELLLTLEAVDPGVGLEEVNDIVRAAFATALQKMKVFLEKSPESRWYHLLDQLSEQIERESVDLPVKPCGHGKRNVERHGL